MIRQQDPARSCKMKCLFQKNVHIHASRWLVYTCLCLSNVIIFAYKYRFRARLAMCISISAGKIGRRSLTAQHLQRLVTGFGQIHRPLLPSLDCSKVFMACFPSYEVGHTICDSYDIVLELHVTDFEMLRLDEFWQTPTGWFEVLS